MTQCVTAVPNNAKWFIVMEQVSWQAAFYFVLLSAFAADRIPKNTFFPTQYPPTAGIRLFVPFSRSVYRRVAGGTGCPSLLRQLVICCPLLEHVSLKRSALALVKRAAR